VANTTKNVHNTNFNSLLTNIRTLISEKRRARALYQRTRLPSHKKIYNKLGNHLKKVLTKIKNLSYENFLTKLSANNGSLWKASKQALHFKITTPHIKTDTDTHTHAYRYEVFNELHKNFKVLVHSTFKNSFRQVFLIPKYL